MSADREIPASWQLAVALLLVALGLWLIATAGCASKRASVPSPINGPVRPLPEVSR